jgi:hypothetical protein
MKFKPTDVKLLINTIDLVLIDQQSVVKRSLHLMNTINEKKTIDNLLAC